MFRVVGDLVGDFDHAVKRAGMHDDGIRLGQPQFFAVEAVSILIPHQIGRGFNIHAFELDAEHHHDVRAVQTFGHRGAAFSAQFLGFKRQEIAGADDPQMRAQLAEQENVRAGDAAVPDIAANRDIQAGDSALALPYGEGVQQRLRRMLVRAVARVDDGAVDHIRDFLRRAAFVVADDDSVDSHRAERPGGIGQAFAFFDRRGGDIDINDFGVQTFGRQFKAGARSG